MTSAVPFPGASTPAVGFEQPFEMLEACHDRVRRSLALLNRLVAHIDANGHDAASRSAASDVLRYFDLAAPLHHEDEELHVFPALLAQHDAELSLLVERLRADHLQMAGQWALLRQTLLQWAESSAAITDPARAGTDAAAKSAMITALERERVAAFAGLYTAHLELEETRVFPVASAQAGSEALARIGAEMQSRRRR